jgi:hypothetical protein
MQKDSGLDNRFKGDDEPVTTGEVAQQLRSLVPSHPALNRLHRRLVASSGVETVITSYDRMYHRHARS